MDYITFYNRYGKPIAYLSERDKETIYMFNGKPVAWIDNDCIYSFKGKHLGWYEHGWIYDQQGYCVFFTDEAKGGPVKPIKQIKPIRNISSIRPIKGIKEIKPIKQVKKLSWANNSDKFFE